MTDARARRQKLIADMIRSGQVASQEQLTAELARRGLPVTQATVSRDLDQLGAVKMRRGGAYCYALPDQVGTADWPAERLRQLASEWVRSAEPAGNLLVLRTPPGSAHLVAFAIDQAQLPDVAGTVAGDDTIFLAVRGADTAVRLADWFRNPSAEQSHV